MQWLAAVEVALLKGRHPLLDVKGLHKQMKDVPKTLPEQPISRPHEEDVVSTSETTSQSTLEGSPDGKVLLLCFVTLQFSFEVKESVFLSTRM